MLPAVPAAPAHRPAGRKPCALPRREGSGVCSLPVAFGPVVLQGSHSLALWPAQFSCMMVTTARFFSNQLLLLSKAASVGLDDWTSGACFCLDTVITSWCKPGLFANIHLFIGQKKKRKETN